MDCRVKPGNDGQASNSRLNKVRKGADHAPRRRHRSSRAQRREFRPLEGLLRQGAGVSRLQARHTYPDMAGWSNGKTLFWIAAADAKGKTHKYRKGDIGFHHYAFELSSRKDVDALGAFLVEHGMNVVDPPGEYYEPSYYAVYFTDPDGMKLEGMVFKPPPKQRRAGKKTKRA
jgi:catechol 2,3-dioxygenase-like lactoylglutathione lyase family enzyme